MLWLAGGSSAVQTARVLGAVDGLVRLGGLHIGAGFQVEAATFCPAGCSCRLG